MDKINPDHYKSHPSGVECIEIVQHHDFLIGNAIKYLWRAGLKNESTEIEDLKKAVWYIERKINLLSDSIKNETQEINLFYRVTMEPETYTSENDPRNIACAVL